MVTNEEWKLGDYCATLCQYLEPGLKKDLTTLSPSLTLVVECRCWLLFGAVSDLAVQLSVHAAWTPIGNTAVLAHGALHIHTHIETYVGLQIHVHT